MESKKLISMTDFVLNGQQTADPYKLYDGCFKYAMFLKRPLELGMFIPCDENGNVLEEPKRDFKEYEVTERGNSEDAYYEDFFEYQNAKERCLFEGFEYCPHPLNGTFVRNTFCKIPVWSFESNTIEDLVKFELPLTNKATNPL